MKKPDIEKRKKVMGRSIRLGHCVCDPSKPCPCPVFRESDVCLCAGEHLPVKGTGKVRLTQHVHSAGCASKIGQKDLHAVLSKLPPVRDPRLVVGVSTADDAGVFEIRPGLLLVQTVDVFTPGVDDPRTFGRIAACNALSDVYAMGGTPVTALSVIGFPIHTLPHSAMAAILRGGMDILAEAGAVLVGGHSINDEEVKFGFAVTGLVKRGHLTTNAAAKPGDALILTKPLGTGIIALAGQLGRASARASKAAAASMATLNRRAAEAMVRHRVKAATDVTGFGLLGHLTRMMLESKATAEIDFDTLPLLPDVMGYAQAGMYSGANERNASFTAPHTTFAPHVTEARQAILHDAQTSGGLLMAVPARRAAALLDDLRANGSPRAAVIGRVTQRQSRAVTVG
ncbi:MAG: selenide, water dikinase SelD [Kiritimatiellaeota bacterium]|nr:selenide, water dikinase SelD [Kiritimatiellota bacterium]